MRIGLIGAGAIAHYLLEEINQKKHEQLTITSVFVQNYEKYKKLEATYDTTLYTDFDAFLQSNVDIVVEAATVDAVKELLPATLRQQNALVISIGALANEKFLEKIMQIAKTNQTMVYLPSGAIGGLDLVQNAAAGRTLDEVSLVTRKPAHTLVAETVKEPTVVFQGIATEAIKKYPKNMNISIALALAGIGFEKTNVQLIADPTIDENMHTIYMEGDFGSASFTIKNQALTTNPNTSYLAAISIIGTLTRLTKQMKIGI